MSKRGDKYSDHSKPMVPVTPMLDLTFQLLFFFLPQFSASNVHWIEGQMDLTLPAKAEAQAKDPSLVKPDAASSDDLDIPADLTILVHTQLDGQNDGLISAIFVEDRSGKTPIESDKSLLAELERYLKEAKEKTENAQAIRVQGDSKLKWESMVKVMDVCRRAGFDNVGFVQPPDYNLSGQ